MTDTADQFAGWAVVEMLGHLRLAGYATETTIAGAGFVRIDVPGPDGTTRATKYCGGGSIYAITPCDQEEAIQVANPWTSRPRPALPAGDDDPGLVDVDYDEDNDEDEDEQDGQL